MHLPFITHALSLLLGGSCLIIVAADLVRHKKAPRPEIGLSLALGAAFTAIGLLGLLGHLAYVSISLYFTTVMTIMFVWGSTNRLFILCTLVFFYDFYYWILTIYLQE